VSSAIDKYVYVTVAERRMHDEFRIKYSITEDVKKVEDIKHTRIREALKLLDVDEKVDDKIEITTMADVPAGTGLGSSSSFMVSLLLALHTFLGDQVSIRTLAEEACHIEQDVLKEPLGKQDQYMAAYGGINQMSIDTHQRVTISPLDLKQENLKNMQQNTLLYYTGSTRHSGDVLNAQKKNANRDSVYLDYYDEIKALGREVKKALESGNLHRFGECLNLHWMLKRRTSRSVSNPDFDRIYDHAIRRGALGGKIVGAGGGGFFVFYVDGNKDTFHREMSGLGLRHMPYSFDLDGARVIFCGR